MRIATSQWIVGWVGGSVLLAVVATAIAPVTVERAEAPPDMVRIDGGPFRMGSEDGSADEQPIHTVDLAAFDLDRELITNAQFAGFLNALARAGGSADALYEPRDPAGKVAVAGERFAIASGFERHPVVGETWEGARAYCAWRDARLPTEAEWERAARGPGGRTFPWGEAPPDVTRARFGFRLYEYVAVGQYPDGATPEGLMDMAGNVWEWTSSLYRAYPYHADDGREDPERTGERVTRGGAHNSPAEMLRGSHRSVGMRLHPPSTRPPVGFRCARDA